MAHIPHLWTLMRVRFFVMCSRQTLTRVSISRNPQRVLLVFSSRAREINFHVSFSSRFSKFQENISFSFLVDIETFFLQLLKIEEEKKIPPLLCGISTPASHSVKILYLKVWVIFLTSGATLGTLLVSTR